MRIYFQISLYSFDWKYNRDRSLDEALTVYSKFFITVWDKSTNKKNFFEIIMVENDSTNLL